MSGIDNSESTVGGSGTVTEPADFGSDDKAIYDRWQAEYEEAKKDLESRDFRKDGTKAVQVYSNRLKTINELDVKDNIFHAYIDAMIDIVYARPPVTVVRAREGLRTAWAIEAEDILQKNMARFTTDPHCTFYSESKRAVLDYLLPGRGVLWPRLETVDGEPIRVDLKPGEAAPKGTKAEKDKETGGEFYMAPNVVGERIVTDYVPWQDYFESPSKTDAGVRWRMKRNFLAKPEVEELFGADVAAELTYKSDFGTSGDDDSEFKHRLFRKAEIREFHCKEDGKVYFISPGYEKPILVKTPEHPLEKFFECPKPLCATLTNESTVPVCEYKIYGHFVDKINELTIRISNILSAVKVVGAYDASHNNEIKNCFVSVDTTMIPVDDWEAFAEAGGFAKIIDFIPMEMFIQGIEGLRAQRQEYINDFGERTGYSEFSALNQDGMTQKEKQKIGAFANVRTAKKQAAVQDYMESLLQVVAEMICKNFGPETLLEVAGINLKTVEPERVNNILRALVLLKDSFVRNFTITVQTDSTIAINERLEKQQRIEFSNASTQFFQAFQTMGQIAPEFIPAAVEIFLFNLDAFRCARPVEEKLKQGLDKYIARINAPQPEPPPDPKLLEVQQNAEIKKAELDLKTQEAMAEDSRKREDSQMKFQGKMTELSEQQRQFQEKIQFEIEKFTREQKYKFIALQTQVAIEREKNNTDVIQAQMKTGEESKVALNEALISAQTELQKEEIRAANKAEIESKKILVDGKVRMTEIFERPEEGGGKE